MAANADNTVCGEKPQWAGLVCLTDYAGTPSAGPALPVTHHSGFNWMLAPTTVVESANGAERTTTTTYDSKLRVATVHTETEGLPGSTPVSGTRLEYHDATGQLIRQMGLLHDRVTGCHAA